MFGSVLVQVDGQNILLDTCLGEVDVPDYVPADVRGVRRVMYPLVETMEKYAMVKPSEVDMVIISHHHSDHVGWNVRCPASDPNGAPVATFPKPTHVYQQAEWDYPAKHFACPWRREWEVKSKPLQAAGLVKLVEGDTSLLPSVQVLSTKGRTPGHQCVRIESRGQVAYYVGDVLHTVPQVTWPEFSPIFDCCRWTPDLGKQMERPPLARDASAKQRKALLQRIYEDHAVILSPHLPFPGIGRLEEIGGGRFRYVPVAADPKTASCFSWCCAG
mmetsp:Transcript_45074/g.114293  ORF Transcript_45074/g.114293 Transcript_45074/m.114293 type:complete len:273 (+) Transcript_45074:3-821(+)